MQGVSERRTEAKVQKKWLTIFNTETTTIITSCESRAIKTAQEQQEVATKNVFFSGFGAHKA